MDGWILFRPEALSLKGLGTLNTYNPDRFSHGLAKILPCETADLALALYSHVQVSGTQQALSLAMPFYPEVEPLACMTPQKPHQTTPQQNATQPILTSAIIVEMALFEAPSVESIRDNIMRDGFYFSKDPVLGQQVTKMDEDGTPFASASGLQFCQNNVADNPVS
jgi:hypothetical protein